MTDHIVLQGFYAVYEGLFEKLARQEQTAFDRREERGRNQRDFQYPARFGGPPQFALLITCGPWLHG